MEFALSNEGKKLKFYDVPYLAHRVLQAGYDVKYFGDKGLGLKAVYVALGRSASEAGQETGLYTHLPMRFANFGKNREKNLNQNSLN